MHPKKQVIKQSNIIYAGRKHVQVKFYFTQPWMMLNKGKHENRLCDHLSDTDYFTNLKVIKLCIFSPKSWFGDLEMFGWVLQEINSTSLLSSSGTRENPTCSCINISLVIKDACLKMHRKRGNIFFLQLVTPKWSLLLIYFTHEGRIHSDIFKRSLCIILLLFFSLVFWCLLPFSYKFSSRTITLKYF